MKVLLVSTNLISVPPIAPYALDILGSALEDAGHEVRVCDLTFADTPEAAPELAASHVRNVRPDAVCVTLRNTSDLILTSLQDLPSHGSFIQDHRRIIERMKQEIEPERIILGGSGFSSMPELLLRHFGLRWGVKGPGDSALLRLLPRLGKKGLSLLSGIENGQHDALYPRVRRTFVDNRWYYEHGGLAAIRTTNGCGMHCAYCVEPSAKGSVFIRRTTEDVMREMDQLVDLGIHDLHSADSEFNLPLPQSKNVLRAIIQRGYPRDVRFWLYCQPKPFDRELAELMERANVAGINFGTDHTDADMLRRLGKWYTFDDVTETTRLCHDHGIAVAHILLCGSPGDTLDNMRRAIDALYDLHPRVIGALLGIAVLPGTPMAKMFETSEDPKRDGFLMPENGVPYLDPVFYVDPAFRLPEAYVLMREHVGERIRSVMVTSPRSSTDESGQIVGSQRVKDLLRSGVRGAYWYHYPDRFNLAPAAP